MSGTKVKLMRDYTDINPKLIVGCIGYTVENYGVFSQNSDAFVGVCFPEIATIEINRSYLEIVDEEYLRKIEMKKKQYVESASNVKKTIGVKGGFKHLQFQYINSDGICESKYIYNKNEALEIEELFTKHEISIELFKIKNK